jgi:hypothetical protein
LFGSENSNEKMMMIWVAVLKEELHVRVLLQEATSIKLGCCLDSFIHQKEVLVFFAWVENCSMRKMGRGGETQLRRAK